MDFTAFNAYMVADEPIKRYGVEDIPLGYEFGCKYPTYRGAYLCNIEKIEVTVDGRKIPQEQMRFGINNKWFLISQLKDLFAEYWFTGSAAHIRILDEKPIADGEHTIHMYMQHKIPYTGYFGHFLVIDSSCTKKLNVAEGGYKHD